MLPTAGSAPAYLRSLSSVLLPCVDDGTIPEIAQQRPLKADLPPGSGAINLCECVPLLASFARWLGSQRPLARTGFYHPAYVAATALQLESGHRANVPGSSTGMWNEP